MTVITAASGKLGQTLASAFKAKGLAGSVKLAARAPEKLAAQQAQGFTIVAADYDDPASLQAAFAGEDVAVIISSVGPNEVRIAQHHNAIQAAKAAGIQRIVYTGATNPADASLFDWAKAHVATEAELKASGIAYTILRDNSYFANNDALFANAKESGVLPFTGIEAKVAYVSHEDVADAIVAAVTGTGHANRIYELSGHEAYSAIELAAILSTVTGKKITALDVPVSAFEAQFRSYGLPEFVVTGVGSFYAALGAGEYAQTSTDVETLTGHASTTAQAYLARFA
ncbi:NAD(P)H dehydrogenase (quinone) [Angulomicrobium tetraedrale]|uniref:NAD(P)H dehydrogenase (Quinone) n=1 Tax=Ancylobacter tetraedralis TaxID=217068 RepID=A0A839ZFK0_9HYPH|nr:SDR family oxidoreductase [Ancylobacter tetraedralis]MBB3773362.1 NAD(P)H dehydrogenase (quinone) [Ancylobacter tetraedralis]